MARRLVTLSLALAAAPAAAQAAPLTVGAVFANAHPIVQGVMAVLIACSVAAVIVGARKVASGPHLAGGSAFLSGLRLGGPLIGCLGAAYTALMIFLGISNVPSPAPMKVIAPGLAEVTLMLGLGLLCGVVAVIANWAVEARIDRAVLRS
ncbi:MAG: hypothetical protein Q8Q88_13360 [Phenylobacterium sp.]|uniref:hypothetical protein n=1 Tax=Phenylobacterium sp. TaxID=1871053 RepID=UPI002736F804|nr:hypothetical protein [Phenylobacterium sp.]MDP3748024.1 hypothetical protein [Phenylobacterium sp.]